MELQVKSALKSDFEIYAEACLKIVSKAGGLVPLKLNRAQRYAHELIEEQYRNTGKVRALILKGRQQGLSTYIAGRFYWKITHRKGATAFVLSHKTDTTDMLFNMTRRYHDNIIDAMRPTTRQDSSKAIYFDGLESRYSIGTAGGKESGRGGTINYLHASECAFWENDAMHMAGLFQAVPSGKLAKDTEIILESTANGTSGMFYRMWQEPGEFIRIFIPWYWQDEYSAEIQGEFELSPEDMAYKKRWKLNREQMYWRHLKIRELGDVRLFQQEFPASAEEAFLQNLDDSFIPPELAVKATETELSLHDIYGAVILGVDPAGQGDDETAFCIRQGRRVIDMFAFKKIDTMEIVGKIINYIREYNVTKCFVDSTGLGVGVVDRLKELGYVKEGKVLGVGFGTTPVRFDKYANKRAELWGEMRDWLSDGPVQIPSNKDLVFELTSPKYKVDSNGRLLLEKKEDMRKRGAKSPNLADALAVTFAFPVLGTMTKNKVVASLAEMSYDELNW